jgi:cell pole-organizing protein PopZ
MPPDPSSMPVTLAYVKELQARLASAHKGVSDEIARVKELIDRQHARTLEALNEAKQTNDEQKRQLDEMVEDMMKANDEQTSVKGTRLWRTR